MEKRYQVFISSTFQDLQPARQEVSQALLRADCFPAGMELFPPADEAQFRFIKKVIDQSDYYVVISAGRYGSIHPETGLSYTEMEYDYAVKTNKPVIRLLHKDPLRLLEADLVESTAEGIQHLERFRAKLTSNHLVRFWSSKVELALEVILGLLHLQRTRPAAGWVRVRQENSEPLPEAEGFSEPRARFLFPEEHTYISHTRNLDKELKLLETKSQSVNSAALIEEIDLLLKALEEKRSDNVIKIK